MSDITPESVKSFIADATKCSRESWLVMADRSWNEIKRTQKNKRLWTTIPNAVRKKTKYPAWWSIYKIRQPLYLSRIGIPIGRDTTQDGNDTLGACAAICKERLATNLAKSFDFFDVMSSVRDDVLATNVGFARAYYEAKDVKEEVKIRLQQSQDDQGNPVLVDPEGNIINDPNVGQDDEGFFLETEEIVDVTEEKVCLEHVLYKFVYVDPTIKRWPKCKQIAFEEQYTELEFKHLFGKKAFLQLSKGQDDQNENKDKKRLYTVYEYWDLYDKEVKWLPKEGDDFIFPKDYSPEDEEAEKLSGLYDLENFFPVVKPFILNQPTDAFWPVTEYLQLVDILEDIHTIFSRMMLLTKAIRARLLFDNNVEGLASALNELSEADAIGVTNLTQALVNSGGSLEGVVQYIPVEKMIAALEQIYTAMEQRLNTLYKLTGTSDLLQGFVTDPQQRTFGERQMQEKYALNQSAEGQRKMAEFVRDSYELICEMALKNFKDESLDRYIMPETLQPEKQEQYRAALELLKSNNKRFRIELETDSTIALNEEFDKQMRLQLVDTVTNALEKTANIAQNSPALIVPELHLLKYLIQGFRQGKLFQSEVTQSIEQLIQQASSQPPAFNKDEANNQIKQQELALKQQEVMQKGQEAQAHFQLEQYKVLSDERFNTAKAQLEQQIANVQAQATMATANAENLRSQVEAQASQVNSQIEQFKIQGQHEQNLVQARLAFEKIQEDVNARQEEILFKRQELAATMQDNASKAQVAQMQTALDARIAEHEAQISDATQSLAQQKLMLDEQEKYATEQRLQAEHQQQKLETAMKMVQDQREHQALMMQALQPPVVTEASNLRNTAAPAVNTKKKVKIVRDAAGNPMSMEVQKGDTTVKVAVNRDEKGKMKDLSIEHEKKK